MVKLDFKIQDAKDYHQYCLKCHSENINRVFEDGKTYYYCDSCHTKSPRLLVIDPKIVWWIDQKTKDYWHESIGVFISNPNKKVLFFDRKIFEFGFAIPAGHLNANEVPMDGAVREVDEEVGLKLDKITLFSREAVMGDGCRRGADAHMWNLFKASVDPNQRIKMNDEGMTPLWLTLEEISKKNLTFAAKYFIDKYQEKLFE